MYSYKTVGQMFTYRQCGLLNIQTFINENNDIHQGDEHQRTTCGTNCGDICEAQQITTNYIAEHYTQAHNHIHIEHTENKKQIKNRLLLFSTIFLYRTYRFALLSTSEISDI